MTLPELWFIIVALLWTGFFILEGFDLGVGMLHGHVGQHRGRQASGRRDDRCHCGTATRCG